MKQISPESPSKNLQKLAAKLFPDEAERQEFICALLGGSEERNAIVWLGERSPVVRRVPETWQPHYVDVIDTEAVKTSGGERPWRPGSDPRHDAGEYYCLDLSSVFAASAFSGIQEHPRTILDLCASPGGKSICAARAFAPELLVCNEVIGKRTAQLIANLQRCHIPAVVTSNDVAVFAEKAKNAFDLVIVDTPCSGQSLVARGKKAPACFHPSTINQNANRQRRIVANAAQCVAPAGALAYMTCTYSPEENEGVLEWLLGKFPTLSAVDVPALEQFRSRLTAHPCYRLFPHSHAGAGAFVALLRRSQEGERGEFAVEDFRVRMGGDASTRVEDRTRSNRLDRE